MAHLAERPAHAAAKTLRRVQAGRAALDDLEGELKGIAMPVLLLVGDQDEPCSRREPLDEAAAAERAPRHPAGVGHAINLEEPALFNQLVERFIADVERSSWRPRDPRARS
jgi:proline iminopeptidase